MRAGRALLALLALLAWLICAPAAQADDARELHYDLRVDLPLTAGAAALWGASAIAQPKLAPTRCRWCDDNAFDARARSRMRWDDVDAARRASNWMALGALPVTTAVGLGAFALDSGTPRTFGVDLLIVTQAVMLSSLVNQIVKLSVGRERPDIHALSAADKRLTRHPSDNNLSFYSAHTSLAFSMVVAAGTTATLREYRYAPLVWAVGLPLAAFTGYLRIGADRHYLSDVLVGAAMGSAIGALTPWLLHGPRERGAVSVASVSPPMLTWTFVR